MKEIVFKTTGEWNLQGSSKKRLYVSLVTKIDDWKKNVIFYKSVIGKKAFNFLLQFTEEPRIDWTFLIIKQGGYMNSIFASQILSIKDELGKVVFEEISKQEND